jgi:hypothetical protein
MNGDSSIYLVALKEGFHYDLDSLNFDRSASIHFFDSVCPSRTY